MTFGWKIITSITKTKFHYFPLKNGKSVGLYIDPLIFYLKIGNSTNAKIAICTTFNEILAALQPGFIKLY